MNDVIARNEDIRHNIVTLEQRINEAKRDHNIPDPECPLTHVFAPGAYARQIFIPKDTLVVGKIHKHAHLNMLMVGKVLVATEEGPVVYEAPRVMTSKAGTKRVVYTYTDTVWTTVHLTDKTDLDQIEDEIIVKDYATFDALQDPEVQQLLHTVQHEVTPWLG
jgi:hypothetical protein